MIRLGAEARTQVISTGRVDETLGGAWWSDSLPAHQTARADIPHSLHYWDDVPPGNARFGVTLRICIPVEELANAIHRTSWLSAGSHIERQPLDRPASRGTYAAAIQLLRSPA
jgi:hypothetical protein